MRGDVNEPALAPFLLEHGGGGTFAEEQFGRWYGGRNRLGFIQNERCCRVRNPEYKTGSRQVRGPGLTKAKNCSARRVGNTEGVDEILLAVEQGMKRQGMENAVRHDEQMVTREPLLHGAEQFVIDLFQVPLCSFQ